MSNCGCTCHVEVDGSYVDVVCEHCHGFNWATADLAERQSKQDDSIEVLTVYSPTEANYYLLNDYLKNPTRAKVIKHIEYTQPPVVRLIVDNMSVPTWLPPTQKPRTGHQIRPSQII